MNPTETPTLTHSEKTIIIEKVCKKYRDKLAKMSEKEEKWKMQEQCLWLQQQCVINGLRYEGIKNILGLKNEY